MEDDEGPEQICALLPTGTDSIDMVSEGDHMPEEGGGSGCEQGSCNVVEAASSAVKVVVRVRPMSGGEMLKGSRNCVLIENCELPQQASLSDIHLGTLLPGHRNHIPLMT